MATATVTATGQIAFAGMNGLVRKSQVARPKRWGAFLLVCAFLCPLAGIVVGLKAALALLTAVGFAAVMYGLFEPVVGLMGISMLCVMDPLSRALLFSNGPFPWNTFNYWLLIAMFLSIGFLLKLNDPQSRILQLFVLLMAFGLLFTPQLKDGIETILNVISFFGILYYFSRNNKNEAVWYWQALVAGTLGVTGGFVYYLESAHLPPVNANTWAYFPVTAIFAVCLGFRSAPRRGKGQLILGLIAVVNLVWIFLSGSRGTLLTGAICMIYLIVSMRKKSHRIAYIFCGMLLGGFLMFGFGTQNQEAVRRIDKLFNSDVSLVGRTSGRSELALGGWYIFLDHPFGIGTGGFATAWARIGFRQELTGYDYGVSKEAHSGWIKALAENGFLGVIVVAVFALSFTYSGWQRRRRGLFPIGLFVTAVLLFAWLSTEFASKGLWFLTAGATALLHMKAPPLTSSPARAPVRPRRIQAR
jgi:O-antigen ligase